MFTAFMASAYSRKDRLLAGTARAMFSSNKNEAMTVLQTASEVRTDLRFEIYGPNYICYHVCLDCFDPLWTKWRKEERKKEPTYL